MSVEVLSIGSTNLVRLDELTNATTGTPVDTATVSFILKDSSGTVLVNTTSMPFVSSGRYEGNIPGNTALTENAMYTLELTATNSGVTLFRKVSCVAKYRSNQ